jgi:ParB-like chromosome segregation protein Spo0J
VVRAGLSVRQAEEAARRLNASVQPERRIAPRTAALDPDTGRLLDALRDRLKTRVRLVGTPSRGRLEVEFFGPEELHRVTQVILGEA